MSDEEVEAVAKGRVWSGLRARSLGLVDALGGLDTAVAIAREEAGLPDDEPASLTEYPPARTWVSKFLGDGRDNSESMQSRAPTLRLERVRAGVRALDALGLEPRSQELLQMPQPEVTDGGDPLLH